MHRLIDVRLRLERLVPGGVRAVGRRPRPARDRLDDLNRDVPFPADGQDLLEALPVPRVLRHEEVVRQQHRVEVEAREAASVHGGDGPAVTGHADEARQSLLAGLDRRLERAAGPERPTPVVGMSERVQLDQVDLVDAQPLERAVDVLAGLAGRPHPGLRCDEEVLPVARHPRADAQLGVAVPRGGVDVVDAVPEQELERPIGVRLTGLGQRGSAEQGHRAPVAGPSERSSFEHGARGRMIQAAAALRQPPGVRSCGPRASRDHGRRELSRSARCGADLYWSPRMNPSGDALRVLVVEDEPGVLTALQDFVRELGCQPVGALTAEEALRLVESEPVDVVLLDLRLPGMSGLDFLRLRAFRDRGIPVVVISGIATEPEAHEALELGAIDFLRKPIGLDRLADVLSFLQVHTLKGRLYERRAPRAAVTFPVRVDTDWEWKVLDLSPLGVKIAPQAWLRAGATVQLLLALPDGGPPLAVDAVLARTEENGDVLSFVDLKPSDFARLTKFVNQVRGQGLGEPGAP